VTLTIPKKNGKKTGKKGLSEEERLKKLEEMKKDAEDLEKTRLERVKKYNEEDAYERAQVIKDTKKETPNFINSLGKDVFSGGSTASIEDRVKRNRYYIQKTNLDERGMIN